MEKIIPDTKAVSVMSLVPSFYIEGEKITAPTGKPEKDIVISSYRVSKSMTEPSDMAEVLLFQQVGNDLSEQAAALSGQLLDTDFSFELGLSYRSQETEYIPYNGFVHDVEFSGHGHMVRIEAIDDRPFHRPFFKKAYKNIAPKQAVEIALEAMGINDYLVELPGKPIRHQVSDNATAFDVLASIRSTAKIPFSWYFNPMGTFVWAPWNETDWTDDSGVTYVFKHQENISSFTPVASDNSLEDSKWTKEKQATSDPAISAHFENMPKGGVFVMETVCQPWLQPGIVIKVDYPDVYPGMADRYRIDGLEHFGGRTKMVIRAMEGWA